MHGGGLAGGQRTATYGTRYLRDFRRELSWRGRVGLKSCLQVQLDRITSVNTIEHGSKLKYTNYEL